MALLFMDGFDLYGSGESDSEKLQEAGWILDQAANVEPQTNTGRFGGGAIRLDGTGNWASRPFTMTGTTFIAQFAVFINDLSTGRDFVEVYNNSGVDLCFRLATTPTGAISLDDSAGTLKDTSAGGVLSEDVWHYFEIKVTSIGNTATVLVHVDEVEALNVSNVDVTLTASTVFDALNLGGAGSAGNNVFYDDVVIMDGSGSNLNDMLGDVRISTLLPDGDSTPEQWSTQSGADSYAMVDDTAPGRSDEDTTYIQHGTTTEKTQLTLGSSPTNTAVVHAVGVVNEMKKDDAGARTARAYISSNGSTSNGATQSPTTSYQLFRDYFEQDPDGGGTAWDKSAVDALQVGVEIVS